MSDNFKIRKFKSGGKKPVDLTDSKHLDRAWGAVKIINEETTDEANYRIPIKILSGTRQPVGGSRYDYEVLFGESTNDKKNIEVADVDKNNCEFKENGNRAIYHVRVWEQIWINFQQFTVEKVRDVEANEQF